MRSIMKAETADVSQSAVEFNPGLEILAAYGAPVRCGGKRQGAGYARGITELIRFMADILLGDKVFGDRPAPVNSC